MKVRRGDIVYLKEAFAMNRHIQGGNRPFVVISNNLGNLHSSICLIVPLTRSKCKHSLPTHANISYHDSICLCEQIFTISQFDISTVKYHLSHEDMRRINRGLETSLDLWVRT